jgi:RNA polymerase sigma-70 factor (ECF subfamily)
VTREELDEQRWCSYMASAHRGDARRYEQLLQELSTVIKRYILRRFGALSFTEDCVQECLLAIHAARHTYNPARPFRPWLFTIVRNKTVDLLRRSQRVSSGDRPAACEPGTAADPADEFEAGELLGLLSPEHAKALVLTKIDGYSLSEAADRVGVSVGAMKSRVSRALLAAERLLRRERDIV